VFHNHAGCRKSLSEGLRGDVSHRSQEDYDARRGNSFPDTKTLIVAEGKDESKIDAAQKQLDNLDEFDRLLHTYYKDYTIKRGLVIHRDSKYKGVLRYPVWLTLNLKAPSPIRLRHS